MALVAYTPTAYSNGSAPALDETNLNKSEAGIEAVTDEVISHGSRITTLEAPIQVNYTPQATAPTHAEGQTYYDEATGTFAVQGAYSDVTLNTGREMHMEVVNNSGSTILNGMACRQDGVLAGQVQIVPAIASSFDTSLILGVATHNIATGSTGIITTFGEVNGLDTSGLTTGTPMYLSDTVAGAWTTTIPDIATQVGGVVVDSATVGKLFVMIRNNINPPAVIGALAGQTTGVYSVTSTAQNVLGYSDSGNVAMTVDATLGIITPPIAGFYRVSLSASISFTSTTSTRVVDFEIWNNTDSISHGSYAINIPRDATNNTVSLSPALSLLSDKDYVIRLSGTTMTLTIDDIYLDISSLHIR